jgi:hypothetical protein
VAANAAAATALESPCRVWCSSTGPLALAVSARMCAVRLQQQLTKLSRCRSPALARNCVLPCLHKLKARTGDVWLRVQAETHTVTGGKGEERGVLPRALERAFTNLQEGEEVLLACVEVSISAPMHARTRAAVSGDAMCH